MVNFLRAYNDSLIDFRSGVIETEELDLFAQISKPLNPGRRLQHVRNTLQASRLRRKTYEVSHLVRSVVTNIARHDVCKRSVCVPRALVAPVKPTPAPTTVLPYRAQFSRGPTLPQFEYLTTRVDKPRRQGSSKALRAYNSCPSIWCPIPTAYRLLSIVCRRLALVVQAQ
ncbi:hypothetical protein PHLGIDRAFT_390601 [Phlebiopsis gigantea 11061_1 CR5-6]|uniref:Uncharacterized protein n=1 Tax=Phlebiopsis gigantea (strain 11061_1 CR5-6) TaxID=745531 RepID=A0A0C3S147_PHLG1|nr:hypothetical protein PHLGIDRAFT_390601 [Phlebiopsis gigantea 11061_1 CR5-6]